MEQTLTCITLEAGQDLSAKQYHFVTIASDGQIDPTGDGALADGVLQNDPASAGAAATVAIAGITKVVCGGNVTRGALVASDANGQCVDAVSSDEILGKALESGTSGAIIPILLKLSGRAPKP